MLRGNEPDLLNSSTVTWDFWVAVHTARRSLLFPWELLGSYEDTQHEQQGTTRIAKSPYWLTLREDASTCETRSKTGPALVPKTDPRSCTQGSHEENEPAAAQTGDGADPRPLPPQALHHVAPWTFAMGGDPGLYAATAAPMEFTQEADPRVSPARCSWACS